MPTLQGSTAINDESEAKDGEVKGTIVTKANGRHYVATHVRRDGKWRQVSHGGYGTKREAEAALRAVLTQMDKGTYAAPSKMTLAHYINGVWLPSMRAAVRPSTFDSYARNLRLHVLPVLGDVGVQQITAPSLRAMYADLLATGKRNGPAEGLSPTTVRYIHTTLRKALQDAVNDNLLPTNPAAKVVAPRTRSRRAREMSTWTAPQLRTFLDHVADHRLSAAWHLAASTGMRRGEVLGLRWSDINFDAGRISIAQTLLSVAYDVQLSDTKTSRGTRVIDLDARTLSELRRHRRRQAEERLLCGSAYNESVLVFTQADGGRVHPESFSQMFQRVIRTLGLPRIRLHDLRHTHATLALQAGVQPKVISDRLGHSTVAFTMDVYAHAIPAMQAEAAERVADLVWA